MMSGNLKMTVNVSLCGSIPRSQMNFCSKKRLLDSNVNSSKCKNSTTSVETSSLKLTIPRQVSCEAIHAPAPPPIIEPPSWAVAARGDARLEPVCESQNLQTPVDLTTEAVFRIGRSQNSDVQLMHCTSSRRHAILFHHPNGSCYIVDCGSAHGTYVNGKRVTTMMHQNGNDSCASGMILPHRVKKGALIRFGGPGAPSFVLKSFSVSLKSLMHNLEETKKTNICKDVSNVTVPVKSISEIKNSTDRQSLEALTILNTRLNALGKTNQSLASTKELKLRQSFMDQLQSHASTSGISYLKKRTTVSFDDDLDFQQENPHHKKRRITTKLFQNVAIEDLVSNSDVAIVSPSRQKPTFVFNFDEIERPVVSPTPLEQHQAPMNIPTIELNNSIKKILAAPLALPSSSKKNRRVYFCDDAPKVFYPPSVTPEPSSDCESE